jgi:archaellum component FlaC
MTISNPADRKKIREALQEISNSFTRIEAERDLIKDIINDTSESHELSKKVVRKMAKVYHKQNFSEEVATHEEFEALYEEITSSAG